ncbi:MAG: hypothetical protein EPO68_17290 [Planctomycetota bacterium]|nr:MAG: hypothetical protein EPO68_17290 [Planctomycetota bacterium]
MQTTPSRRSVLAPAACLLTLTSPALLARPAAAQAAPRQPAPTATANGNAVEAAIPGDAWLVVHIGDLGRVRSIAQQNAWAALFQDEHVRPFFDGMTSELIAQATQDLAADAPERALLDARAWWLGMESGALWLGGAPTDDANMKGGFLFEFNGAGAGLAEGVAATLGAHLTPADPASIDGPRAPILAWRPKQSEQHETTTTFRDGNVLGIHFAHAKEVAIALAAAAQTRLAAGRIDAHTSEWLALARGNDWSGHGIEAGIDLASVLPALPDEPGLREFLDVSGFATSRYAWMGGSLCPGECLDMTIALDLPAAGIAADAAKLFGAPPREWLDWMPADTTGLSLGRFDIAGAWDMFWRVFGEEAPEESADVRSRYDGFTGMTGFDFEADLVRQLDGKFGTFTAAVPKDELPTYLIEDLKSLLPIDEQLGAMWMIGLKEPARVQELVDRALEQFAPTIERTSAQHAGAWIETISVEGLNVHWSFTSNALLVSFSPSLMRSTLERVQNPALPDAASNERLMKGLAAHPKASLVSVADSAASVEAQFAALGNVAGMLGMFGGDPTLQSMLTQAPPPKADAVRKHLKGWMTTALEIDGRRFAIRMLAR